MCVSEYMKRNKPNCWYSQANETSHIQTHTHTSGYLLFCSVLRFKLSMFPLWFGIYALLIFLLTREFRIVHILCAYFVFAVGRFSEICSSYMFWDVRMRIYVVDRVAYRSETVINGAFGADNSGVWLETCLCCAAAFYSFWFVYYTLNQLDTIDVDHRQFSFFLLCGYLLLLLLLCVCVCACLFCVLMDLLFLFEYIFCCLPLNAA